MHDLVPLDGDGFEVHARHPGWLQRAEHLHHHTCTAEQVIVAAHAVGSSKLLHHVQHKGRLTGLSSEMRKRGRTPSSSLPSHGTHGEWQPDPEKVHITPGSVAITSGARPYSQTSIEPTYSSDARPSSSNNRGIAEIPDHELLRRLRSSPDSAHRFLFQPHADLPTS